MTVQAKFKPENACASLNPYSRLSGDGSSF